MPGPPAAATAASGPQRPDQRSSGSISGTVVDASGAAIAGALVTLTRGDSSASQVAPSGADGQFSFTDVAAGPFQLTIAAPDLATQILSGTLQPGESYTVGQVMLSVATAITEIRVGPAIAEEQVKEEEQQRVLGVVPNFYVSYIANTIPLSPKQKFELAWKMSVDPITFVLTGAAAGIEQAGDDYSGYGQGAVGFGSRYSAAYGDAVIGTFVGSAILPSLLKQDPRYFYKGTGSMPSRFFYAIANAVICKGDNGHWQAAYSGILGTFAAGGISDLYYPLSSRNNAAFVFENGLTQLGESAAANVFQEFVVRKFTRNPARHRHSATAKTNPDGS